MARTLVEAKPVVDGFKLERRTYYRDGYDCVDNTEKERQWFGLKKDISALREKQWTALKDRDYHHVDGLRIMSGVLKAKEGQPTDSDVIILVKEDNYSESAGITTFLQNVAFFDTKGKLVAKTDDASFDQAYWEEQSKRFREQVGENKSISDIFGAINPGSAYRH